jgi:hypothetical protein
MFKGKKVIVRSGKDGDEKIKRGGDYLYFGKVFRIPKKDFVSGNTEKYFRREHKAIEKLLQKLSDWDKSCEVGEVFEYYVSDDFETGDAIILWRIPVRKKGAKTFESESQEIENYPPPPEELLRITAGYMTVFKAVGEEAAREYIVKVAVESEKLLNTYGIESYAVESRTPLQKD